MMASVAMMGANVSNGARIFKESIPFCYCIIIVCFIVIVRAVFLL